MAEHNDLGKWGEDEAALYLEDEGYTIIDRDWRVVRGGWAAATWISLPIRPMATPWWW